MGKLTLKQKIYSVTMWETQSWKFTTSRKVYVDLFPPEFIVKTIVARKFHIDESSEGR